MVTTIRTAASDGDDDRRQEQQRATRPAGDEVAEAGDQRVEDRRDVARAAGRRVGMTAEGSRHRFRDGRTRRGQIGPLVIHGRQGTRRAVRAAAAFEAGPQAIGAVGYHADRLHWRVAKR